MKERYQVVLRYGVNTGHEYVVTRTRRLNGALKERDAMVANTVANMVTHADEAERVVTGAHPTDEHAVVVAQLLDDVTVYKVVTVRDTRPEPTPDTDLTDALLASVYALTGATV